MGRAIIKKYQTKKSYPGYTRLEWIQGNSGTYFDTGVKLNSNYTVEGTLIFGPDPRNGIWGARDTSAYTTNAGYMMITTSNELRLHKGNSAWQTGPFSPNWVGKKVKFYMSVPIGWVKDLSGSLPDIVYNYGGGDYGSSYKCYLYTLNNAGSASSFGDNELQFCEFIIKKSSTGDIYKHFLPVKRISDGKLGFLEVSNSSSPVFMPCNSSGTWIGGPEA